MRYHRPPVPAPPSLPPPAGSIAPREGYRALLSGSREMRRDHAITREAWFSGLTAERKVDLLFELEVLLRGLSCFANPRNHPGPPRRTIIAAVDFREPLRVAREGMVRVASLSRTLLGEDERVFVFQRYLEQMIPEDTARSRFVRATAAQETPEQSLLALRYAFGHLVEIVDGLLRVERLPFRTFYATMGMQQREVARNTYFNPLRALEFRPELDRIKNPEVFALVQSVPGEEAHRLVALAFLTLFRMLKTLALADSLVELSHNEPAALYRAHLALAALRAEARSLVSYLRAHAGAELAEGFERELFTISSKAMHARYESLLAEGHRLVGIKAALEGIAAKLRLEMRRTFVRELPPIDAQEPAPELRKKILAATESLRPALQSIILFLIRALGARLDAHFVFDDLAAKREVGERLRKDVWMFAQIVRGFAAKAAVIRTPDKSDRWASVESFRFVKEFLGYFKAMGYPLLRTNDYPRFDQFLSAIGSLEETDLLDPQRMGRVVEECEAFHAFLLDLFEGIGKREELAGTPFDRRSAAEALRMYLGG